MRGATQGGRFDTRYEVDSIYEGMADDLYDPAGTVFQWFLYAPELTTVDPIYDIGDPATGGRHWKGPHPVPVLGVRFVQGDTLQNKRGLYPTDSLHAVINVGQMDLVLFDFLDDPDVHYKDRFIWRGELWEPTRLWPRGTVSSFRTVISVDAIQVKPDQIVNDTYFAQFGGPGYLTVTASDVAGLDEDSSHVP